MASTTASRPRQRPQKLDPSGRSNKRGRPSETLANKLYLFYCQMFSSAPTAYKIFIFIYSPSDAAQLQLSPVEELLFSTSPSVQIH